MVVRRHIDRKRPSRAARQRGTWLAIVAILVQSWLPLADAAFHRYADATGLRAPVAQVDPGHRVVAASKQLPAHLAHDCPICQFIQTLGSFSPPALAAPLAPAPRLAFAVWPTAPPVVRAADASAAQPRAPPALI
jgi:hypothetical protein